MSKKRNKPEFIQYLQDELFIEWKLFPNDELDTYWKDFLQQNPHEVENFKLAENHFVNINLSSYKLPQAKKEIAIQQLEQSLRTYHRKRTIRRLSYAVAASVAILVLSIIWIQKEVNRTHLDFIQSAEYIIGNELEKENIQFITGNNITSFERNVEIVIENNKTAQVKSEEQKPEEIPIEQHTINKLIVPFGKQSKVRLPDGTKVWLNSGTTLEFPSAFSKDSREIFLTGEMYIEVAPDDERVFKVRTTDYDIKVYGTKFNVSAYADAPSHTVLIEGSVSLQPTGNDELFLMPEEQAIFSKTTGTFETRKVDVLAFTSWKEGYLTFNDTPISEVLKLIERYYNLSFNFEDNLSLRGITCTGKIILSDNLDNVMTTLTLISHTKYKKEDKLIYIYK